MRTGKALTLIAAVALVAGCASAAPEDNYETSAGAPSAEPPATTAAVEPERRLWNDGFPSQTLEEVSQMPVDDIVSTIHNNPELSENQKAEVAISIAYDRAGSLSEEEIKQYAEEVLTHFHSQEIVMNPDKHFLLRQVVLGASMDKYYEDGIIGDAVGFDYMQIARDLYRGTATPDDDSIQANLHQIQKALSS